jgi:hypothetical protein
MTSSLPVPADSSDMFRRLTPPRNRSDAMWLAEQGRRCLRTVRTRHDDCLGHPSFSLEELCMNNIIYIVGLVVIVLAVLGYFGFR